MLHKVIEKLKYRKFLVVILLLFFAVNIFAIFSTFTEKTSSTIWDGKVASKFKKGSGSAVDPYVISDGGELAYFFTLINSDEYEEYYKKFYVINNNIDLNGYDFSFSNLNKTFSGNLDGNGYTIFNFKLSDYTLDTENDIAHYNLFESLNFANIKNINLSDITIEIDGKNIINERPKEETKTEEKIDVIEEKTDEEKQEVEEVKPLEESKEVIEDTASLIKKYNIRFVQSEEETEEEEVTTNNNEETTPKTEEKPVETPTENTTEPVVPTEEPKTEENKTNEEVKQDEEEKPVDDVKQDEEEKPIDIEEPTTTEPTDDNTTDTEEGETPSKEEPKTEEKKDFVSKITVSLFRKVKDSSITNISLNNIRIDYSGDESKLSSSMFVLNDIENNVLENINISGMSNAESTGVLFKTYKDASLDRIIYRFDGHKLYDGYETSLEDGIYEYRVSEGMVYFDNDYPVKSVLSVFNSNSNLKWKLVNSTFKMENTGSDGPKLRATKARRAAPSAHTSGTDGTVVYVNDYVADWDYYMGLNYTYTSTGALPTTADKSLYGESNLVYVQLNYYANDIDNQYTARQSHNDNYNQYVYYKVYPVENNEVKVPLIDNPFTLRPYNKVFNGWITNYVDAVVELEKDIYQRYVRIPVTMTGGVPDNININIYATWTNGVITTISGSGSTVWNNPINNLDSNGFHAINQDSNNYESITPYYVQRTVNNANYPNGAVDYYGSSLTGRCNGSCTYYAHPTGNYVNGTTYYQLTDHMEVYTVQRIYTAQIPVGGLIAGYFRDANILSGDSLVGYYNPSGDIITSGTCNTNGGCSGYYEMIPYYADSNGNREVVINHKTYYYLTTRDTNVVVMTGTVGRVWSTQNKPLTFTCLNTNANGTADYRCSNSVYFNINTRTLTCYDDCRVENMHVYSNTTPIPANVSSNNVTSYISGTVSFVGNGYNSKIGRNMVNNTTNRVTFKYAIGGSVDGFTQANFRRYKFEVESGIYSTMGVVSRYNSSSSNYYVNAIAVFGSDFDRVTENPLQTNTNATDYPKLEVKYILSGSWSGNLYGRTSSSTTDEIINTTIKSGRYGTNKTDCFTGVYVGGRQAGAHYATRVGTFEGGYVYTVTGGPLSQSANSSLTDTKIYIKGGYQDIVYGGAGTTETYGNKLIQMTGGRVNYSLFGGSNGTTGNNSANSRGTIVGDSFVYIGGNAIVGDPNNVSNNNVFSCTGGNSTVEAGSVFGIGNGNPTYSTVGTMNNSNVIIDGGTINRNVYGGGNYGAVGLNGSNQTYTTKIFVHGGDIHGSVYGGGNNNGGGNNSNTDNITITMDGGTVSGSVYGGSRTEGNVFGNTSVNILAGTILTDVYGGGEGGGASGTFVNGNVDITIGQSSVSNEPTINGSVYGGSAYGTVNAITTNPNYSSSKHVNVTVENGRINGSVFGGAKGSSSVTPYIAGDIAVEINGGVITNVFGGFDEAGKPKGDATVDIYGGTITNVYGGGNKTSIDDTDVELHGGTVGTIYGGSNQHGDVLTTSVTISGGEVGTVFGGNNEGDSCGTTSITMTSGKVTTAIYGGGNLVDTDSTSITITGTTVTNGNPSVIPVVYGGGNQAGVGNSTANPPTGGTEIVINGSNVNITTLFGGSNQSGTVTSSDITLTTGTIGTMFGGNNQGGQTLTTDIEVNSGNVTTIYGGGNEATAGTTNVVINNTSSGISTIYGGGNDAAATTTNVTINSNSGTITNVYGGGNQAGATTTNVTTTGSGVTVTNLFGGSNQSGTVTTSNVTIGNGTVATVYGGNNAGGQTTSTNIEMNNGNVTTIYGGGNEAISGTTSVIVNNTSSTINTIFGGGNKASTGDTSVEFNNGAVSTIYGGGNLADAEDTTVVVNAATNTISNIFGGGNQAGAQTTSVTVGTAQGNTIAVGAVYGGSNQSGDEDETSVTVTNTTIISLFGGNNAGGEAEETHVTVNSSTITNLYGGGDEADSGDTNVTVNSGTITNLYGGGNEADAEDTIVVVNSGSVGHLYGGGNQASVDSTNVTINSGTFTEVFGGGNAAGVTSDTSLTMLGGTVSTNIYGGGNEGTVGGNTDVLIHNTTVGGSAYAGGNGSTAIVTGDTTITVSGTSVVGTASCSNYSNCSVFGGGNAAETGTVATAATATVNIIGGTIYGNVYGGANTSKVYGNTDVKIGAGVTPSTNVVKGDIYVRGTVFGGGEANASGSTTYDFSFISVTQGVTIEIDGANYNNFSIDGSIFGSGNASSSEGASYVTIKNYGTPSNPQYNISLQRANLVTIDNSAIVLAGTTDRTNEYSDVLFSLSRVTELDIKNNTTLYLENGANLLEHFKSLNADGTKATVTFNNGVPTKSTDNRLYVYMGKHLDIAKDQNATDMGEVYGMTFFGMFKYNGDDTVNVGIYGNETAGSSVDWSKVFDNVTSYVAGLHHTNHDIEVDGFYTNFANEETQKYEIDYITPTPPEGTLYMWIIGAGVIEYEVDLNASRYSTLGSSELILRDFTHPNTTFSILGFDYSELESGIDIIEKQNVPKIANSSSDADSIMGISMETSNAGWLVNGQTSFVEDPNPSNAVIGTKSYVKGNSSGAPSVLLYLHHSKNIATAGNMGKVRIQLMSIRQTGPLEKETKRLIITINLSRTLYDTITYEGSMTAGRRYEMFASTKTNITSHSALSAYFALFATDENIYKTGYHRTLVSTFPFPENTKFTMIDLSGSTPEYYYKVISASDYAQALTEFQNVGEVSYNVSMFEAMGAENSGVYYNDVTKNAAYYNVSPEYCEEEFIFIIDFADTTFSADQLNNKLLLEMRNASDATIYSVLSAQHDDLTYNIYNNSDAVIDMSGTISETKIYNGDTFNVDLTIDYTQSTVGSVTVYDTHYFDSKLGIKISLINSENNVVTGTTLLGLNYGIYDSNNDTIMRYDPNIDGTTRIKLADKVDSAEKWIIVNTGTSSIATGHYKLRIESFGSPDGIFYGLVASDMIEFNIEIINEIYGLDVDTTPEEMIINSETGKNENGENSIGYTVFYNSGLTQPNIRFKLYRRNYNTIDDTTYSLVDAQDYFETVLDPSGITNEYILRDEPDEEFDVEFETSEDLVSGTYKMVFELYDDTALIGTVDKYFIIK